MISALLYPEAVRWAVRWQWRLMEGCWDCESVAGLLLCLVVDGLVVFLCSL